jgi:glycolate oxidase FAD binding subunit
MDEFISDTAAKIKQHRASKIPLRIQGGNSKSFYGASSVTSEEVLNTGVYNGIIDYEPKELVLTVRAGTALIDVEKALADQNQMLPFEPPHFGAGATIGGIVATGLSGPRRAYAGATRDFVLGTRIIDGKGNDLNFGGRVIKNVAGYDVSRLMTGAMGTLGVILDISFKVLPRPQTETTLRFEMDEATAITRLNEWAGKPLPISASSYFEGVVMLRLSAAPAGVTAAVQKLGGETVDTMIATAHWHALREHQHAYFTNPKPLWRISVPQTAPILAFDKAEIESGPIEWGGGLRWLSAESDSDTAARIRNRVADLGGHATLFNGKGHTTVASVFHPLDAGLAKIHRNLKLAFDPDNILNRGRMDSF